MLGVDTRLGADAEGVNTEVVLAGPGAFAGGAIAGEVVGLVAGLGEYIRSEGAGSRGL